MTEFTARLAGPADVAELVRLREVMLASWGEPTDGDWREPCDGMLRSGMADGTLTAFVVDARAARDWPLARSRCGSAGCPTRPGPGVSGT